jgi:ubiquinol-cytochrome c reductase iron-sulfur subunit
MSDDEPERPRRDFIVTAAMATTAIGATLAMWPFIAALGPAADNQRKPVSFDLSGLDVTKPLVIEYEHAPVMMFRRTQAELDLLRSPAGEALPKEQKIPKEANNWHRSIRPEFMVVEPLCTHQSCFLSLTPREVISGQRLFICPCCGSRFDVAGRILRGPAPRNLAIPPHRFTTETQVEFSEAARRSWEVSERAPANPRRSFRI